MLRAGSFELRQGVKRCKHSRVERIYNFPSACFTSPADGCSERRSRSTPMRIKQLKLLRFLPRPLAIRVVIALLATRRLVTAVRGRRPQNLSAQQRAAAVVELRRLVPAPRPKSLGGERIGTDTYERFLSVVEWQPERAAPMLKADLVWRARVKPRACRPEHIPKACAQSGWQVLMVGGGTAESGALF